MNQKKKNQPMITEQITSKTQYLHRWKLVYTSFLLQFCSLYAFQDFSSNHDYFKAYFSPQISGDDFEFYYNIIYSVSLLFLIYFAIYSGVICDKFGPSIVILVQWVTMTLGAILMCLSLYTNVFWVIFIGRSFIFMANSTMWISLGTFLLQFFEAHEQSTPQSIMTTAIMALFFNLNISPSVVKAYGVLFECYIILGMCVVNTVISLIIYNIDINLDNIVGESSKRDQKEFHLIEFLKEFKQYPDAFFSFMCQNFLSLIVSTIIEIVGPAFLTSYWHKTPQVAGRICALAPLTSITLVILGKIADKFKKHTQLMIFASFLHIVALLGMPLIPYPEISFIIYGFAFSIRMMLTFPIQSLLIPKKSQGKTYAVTRASKDLFGFMIAFLNGILAQNYGYGPVIYIQAGVSVLVTIAALYLNKQYQQMVKNKDPYFEKLDRINNPEKYSNINEKNNNSLDYLKEKQT